MKQGAQCNMQPAALAASDEFASLLTKNAAPLLRALRGAVQGTMHVELARCFTVLTVCKGIFHPFVEALLRSEVEEVTDERLVLRNNSMAIKVMDEYTKLPETMAYLRHTISEPVLRIVLLDPHKIEINPQSPAAEGADIKANAARLCTEVKSIMNCIIGSAQNCPHDLRQLCTKFRSICEAKFPRCGQPVVAFLMFTHFFVPAVFRPEDYGLIQGQLNNDVRLMLQTIHKCMNAVAFGGSFREPYMHEVAPLVKEYHPATQRFLDEIIIPSTTPRVVAAAAGGESPASSGCSTPTPDVDAAAAAAATTTTTTTTTTTEAETTHKSGKHLTRTISARTVSSINLRSVLFRKHNADPSASAVFTREEYYGAVQRIAEWCHSGAAKMRIPPFFMSDKQSADLLAQVAKIVADMDKVGALVTATQHPGKLAHSPSMAAATTEKEMKALQKRAKELQKMEQESKKKQEKVSMDKLMQERKQERECALLIAGRHMSRDIIKGALPEVKKWLEHDKRNANARTETGETVLHIACNSGKLDIARYLIDNGADLFATDHCGWTPLHVACHAGNIDLVRMLCEHPVDAAATNDDGNTPLHYLVRSPYQPVMEDILQRFLARGADINARNVNLETPLFNAIWKANAGAIDLLLRHGADPTLPNNNRATPLEWASKLPDKTIAKMIEANIQKRAEAASKKEAQLSPKTPKRRAGTTTAQEESSSSMTALPPPPAPPVEAAAPAQSPAITTPVVPPPAEPSPPHAEAEAEEEAPELDEKATAEQRQAIWRSIEEGDSDAVLRLLEANPQLVCIVLGEQTTLLHSAITYWQPRVLWRLLNTPGAPIDTPTDRGQTPLMWAVLLGYFKAAQMMLFVPQNQYDVTRRYEDGRTMLHVVARSADPGAPSIACALIARGADVNATDSDQNTPLHHAATIGAANTVHVLVDAGADKTLRNKDGETAFDIAEKHKYSHTTLVRYLR